MKILSLEVDSYKEYECLKVGHTKNGEPEEKYNFRTTSKIRKMAQHILVGICNLYSDPEEEHHLDPDRPTTIRLKFLYSRGEIGIYTLILEPPIFLDSIPFIIEENLYIQRAEGETFKQYLRRYKNLVTFFHPSILSHTFLLDNPNYLSLLYIGSDRSFHEYGEVCILLNILDRHHYINQFLTPANSRMYVKYKENV